MNNRGRYEGIELEDSNGGVNKTHDVSGDLYDKEDMMDKMRREDKKVIFQLSKCHPVLFDGIEVRGKSVSVMNVLVLFALYLFMYGQQIWFGSMQNDIEEDMYNIPNGQVLTAVADIQTIQQVLSAVIGLVSGMAYDSIGRRIPAAFYFVMIVIGWAALVSRWGHSSPLPGGEPNTVKPTPWEGFFIGYVLLNTFEMSLPSIPIIPDIIMENSQGIVIGITLCLINLSGVIIPPIYTYNAKVGTKIDKSTQMWIFCAMNVVLGFICVPFIKNIIGSKEHMTRSVTSQYSASKCKMIGAAYKQAIKVICSNPKLLVAVGSRMIANAVRSTTGQNIQLSATAVLKINDLKLDELHRQSHVLKWWGHIQTITNWTQMPWVLIIGYLTGKQDNYNMMLICTFLTMITGFGMYFTIEHVYYSPTFEIFYILSEVFDFAGNLIGNVMTLKYLELESRGVTLSIISLAMTIVSIPLTQMNAYLNSAFHLPDPAHHCHGIPVAKYGKGNECTELSNYPLGSKYTILVGYSMMSVYWLVILAYRIVLWKRGK